jgi:hypothetical protein
VLPTIFNFIYELAVGNQRPIFEDKIYQVVGFALLGITFLVAVVFYFILNGFRSRFSKTWPHWGIFLIVNGFLNLFFVIWFVDTLQDPQTAPFGHETLSLAGVNAIYSCIVFLLFSLVFKPLSPHARKTPF